MAIRRASGGLTEKRESKAVFIGRDLMEEDIRTGFLGCEA